MGRERSADVSSEARSLQRPSPIDLAVDTSALVSVLLGEPARAQIVDALTTHRGLVVSAASLLEASMVMLNRKGAVGESQVDELCADSGIITMPVDNYHLAAARDAFARFGKGRHPAALNFGDCFSYALAAHFDVPLLCTGDNFARTGLRVLPTAR